MPPPSTPVSPMRRALIAALLGAGAGLVLPAAWTTAQARRGRGRGGHDDDDDDHHKRHDYESARRSVESGEALPLSTIIEEVKKVVDGEILDVELQKTDAGLIYQIKLLSRADKVMLIWVDAKTKVIQKMQVQ